MTSFISNSRSLDLCISVIVVIIVLSSFLRPLPEDYVREKVDNTAIEEIQKVIAFEQSHKRLTVHERILVAFIGSSRTLNAINDTVFDWSNKQVQFVNFGIRHESSFLDFEISKKIETIKPDLVVLELNDNPWHNIHEVLPLFSTPREFIGGIHQKKNLSLMKGYVGPRLAFVLDCVFRKLNFDAPTEFHPKATTICEDLAPCPQAPTIPEAKSNAIFDEYIGSKNNAIHARNLTIEHWTLAKCPVVLLATPFFENNRASAINFYNGEDAIPVLNAEENFVADCRNFVDCTHLSQVGRSDFTKYICQLLGKLMDDKAWKSNWNESTLISRNEKIRNLFASHPECLIEVDIEDSDIVQILKKRTGWDLHDNASLEQNSIAQGTTVKPRCLLSPY